MTTSKKRSSPGLDLRPSGRWRAGYYDENGQMQQATFATKTEAKEWREDQKVAVRKGTHVAVTDGRITFRAYAEAWRAGQVHRSSSAAHVEGMLRVHAYPVLGDRQMAAIRPSEVQAWVKRLSETLAPSTVGTAHGIVAGIFRAAVRDRCVSASPCDGTRLPREAPREIVPLTIEQVHALADALPARYRALAILAASTGLRHGEAVGLTVDRVNFLRGSLRVEQQLSTVNGGTPFLSPPKTAASHRTVPVPQFALDVLAEHLAEWPAVPVEVPDRRRREDGPTVAVPLLFTTARGHAIRRTTWGDIWRKTVADAGVPTGTGFHSLRHFYASALIRHGESIKTVQARLGHASAAETLDTYSHLWPDSEDRTREALEAAFAPSVSRGVSGSLSHITAGQSLGGGRVGL